MLLLIVNAGSAQYGIAASRIAELIPVPVLRQLPGTPLFVSGVFSYHGQVVPVIDLSMLLTGHPSQQLLSTRILLVDFQAPRSKQPVLLGIMAEHATETLECNRADFKPASVHGSGAPFAGDILVRPDGLIQELNVDRLIATELQDQLFAEAAA
jgi:chemotaxis-related protein WspB